MAAEVELGNGVHSRRSLRLLEMIGGEQEGQRVLEQLAGVIEPFEGGDTGFGN